MMRVFAALAPLAFVLFHQTAPATHESRLLTPQFT